MDLRLILVPAVAVAVALAACSNDTDALTDGTGRGTAGESSAPGAAPGAAGASATGGAAGPAGATVDSNGNVVTNSPQGKAFYIASVHPFLAATCGGCHDVAGPGPNWLTPADAEKSYAQLFSQGYVVTGSRLTVKGTHDGSTTNALNPTQIGTFNQWVGMELADGGNKATPQVLEKLGACFDQTLFNAMQMGQWKTTTRTNNNNTNKVTPWNENANNCTGCNNVPCSTCHSADAATNFNNAEGNPILPPGTTFANTQLTQPAYITKFFGVSPSGAPIASDGIKKKSDATMLAPAYSHPMFTLTTAQQTALDAFVAGAIAKYTASAGACTPSAPAAAPAAPTQ